MIKRFSIDIFYYNKSMYIYPISRTKDNSYYQEFPPFVLDIINTNNLGNTIIDAISKIKFNIDDIPLKADDFAQTFGEKNWNSFVKNYEYILISKEENQVDEFYIVPTIKYRGYWDYDYDNAKIVSINNAEEIGKIIMSFFNLPTNT